MSLNFIVEELKQPDYQVYNNGDYDVEIEFIEEIGTPEGDYPVIHRRFTNGQYENQCLIKHYNIFHPNEMVRSIAKQDLSRLGINIAKLKPGEEFDMQKIVGKLTRITIKNKVSNNGNIYTNIAKEVLLSDIEENKPKVKLQPESTLNDEVPF